MIEKALDCGITFFDTADSYGAGMGERWLGRALRAQRDQVLVATKCGQPAGVPAKLLARSPIARASARHVHERFSDVYIQSSVEKSLRRMRIDHLDVLLLHSPPPSVVADDSWVNVMSELRDRGLIRFYGVSARSPQDAVTALRHRVDCVELEINPSAAERARPALDLARQSGAAVIARQVLGSGRLLDRTVAEIERTKQAVDRSQVARALIQFAVDLPSVDVTLVGMTRASHVTANMSRAPDPRLVLDVARAARVAAGSEAHLQPPNGARRPENPG